MAAEPTQVGRSSSSHGVWPWSQDTNPHVHSFSLYFDGESPCCVRHRAWVTEDWVEVRCDET